MDTVDINSSHETLGDTNELSSAPVKSTEKKKRKKSKKIPKAKGHPKFPKNGYVRFCDQMRLQFCTENPSLDPVEVTKLVAAKWHSLSAEEKKPYNESFKLDQERFRQEMLEFEEKQKALGETVEKVPRKRKRTKNAAKPAAPTQTPASAPAPVIPEVIPKKKEDEVPKAFINSNCELPIFTDAFLEHNKQIEADLKRFRKSNQEIEQQNDVLMKHVENMANGVTKVEGEIYILKQQNSNLEKYLTKLKCILASGLNSLTLPGLKTGASVENITEYMQELASEQKSSTVKAARDILRKIDIK